MVEINSITKIDEASDLPDLIPYRKGNKWGYCNKEKNIIVNCIYDVARPFSEGMAIVKLPEYYGCINKDGQLCLVLPNIIVIEDLKEGIIRVEGSDDQGRYIDIHKAEKNNRFPEKHKNITPLYGYIYDTYYGNMNFSEGLHIARKINKGKEPQTLFNDKYVYSFWSKRKGELIFDDKYELAIDYKYNLALPFSEGLAAVMFNGCWRYINKNDETVLDMIIFNELQSFSEGFAGVKLDEKWGFVDRNGKCVIDFLYDEIKNFSEELSAVKVGKKWGFIDKKGEIKIPIEFNLVSSFSEGLAAVETNAGHGYINKVGDFVIPAKYLFAYPFKNGIANVYIHKKIRPHLFHFYIDKYGNEYYEL